VRDVENPGTDTITIPHFRYRHMEAQIHNDARGWDEPQNVVAANSEPGDFGKIWGNFTKDELPPSAGYALPVGVGHAGDYNGYTVSYREYMSRDHYRKALTCCGSHTADYMSTRMVRMAAALRTSDWTLPPEPHDAFAQADEARQQAEAIALGTVSSAAYDAWLKAIPDDKAPQIVAQPPSIARFQASTFTWRGGSNAVDNPIARVERLVDGQWRTFADETGEVQTMVTFPHGAQGVADTYTGAQDWLWTANFEAFDATPQLNHPFVQTPAGTYRFVVHGTRRAGGVDTPYTLASSTFTVSPWGGITASGLTAQPDGSVTFTIDPVAYPRTYGSAFRFIHDDGAIVCKTCTFRPWASGSTAVSAVVTVRRAGGAVIDHYAATLSGGVWTAAAALQPGDVASIEPGDIRDAFGETNAVRYAVTA
jgi:hypothetical protein